MTRPAAQAQGSGDEGADKTKPPPRVVWCSTCAHCNGWGMLYDGKARPSVLKS